MNPLTTSITWHDPRTLMPDSDTTVLMYTAENDDVSSGYHDGTGWCYADRDYRVGHSSEPVTMIVTLWTEMPHPFPSPRP